MHHIAYLIFAEFVRCGSAGLAVNTFVVFVQLSQVSKLDGVKPGCFALFVQESIFRCLSFRLRDIALFRLVDLVPVIPVCRVVLFAIRADTLRPRTLAIRKPRLRCLRFSNGLDIRRLRFRETQQFLRKRLGYPGFFSGFRHRSLSRSHRVLDSLVRYLEGFCQITQAQRFSNIARLAVQVCNDGIAVGLRNSPLKVLAKTFLVGRVYIRYIRDFKLVDARTTLRSQCLSFQRGNARGFVFLA